MGNYNPYKPYVLGMEWPPLIVDKVLLDTGSEIGYTFRARADSDVTTVRLFATTPPPGQPNRKELTVSLFRAAEVANTGPVRKLLIPCSSGALVSGATLQGGAASVQAAVQNPSDAGYVQLSGASAAMRCWFDAAAVGADVLLDSRRILDVSVLYAVSGPFDALAGAMVLSLERVGAPTLVWPMDDTITGPSAQTANVTPRRSRLGELNPFWDTTLIPSTSTERRPWVYDGASATAVGLDALAVSGGTNINVRLATSAGAAGLDFQVHYVALEISHCVENRIGGGGLDISGGAAYANGLYVYEVPVGSLTNFGFDASLGVGAEYALTVGQGHGGVLTVTSPVPVPVPVVDSITAFGPHRGVLLRKTIRANSTHTTEETAALPAMAVYDDTAGTIALGSHAYLAQAAAALDSLAFEGENVAEILDDAAATYPWIRFYARRADATTSNLTVRQIDATDNPLGPTAELTVAAFDALPELVAGWKQVTLPLAPAVVTTGAGTTRWGFTTGSEAASAWEILGADANPRDESTNQVNDTTYGAETAFARIGDSADLSADLTVALIQEMDEVTGLTVTPAVQALAVVDPTCPLGPGVAPIGIRYHQVTWDSINSLVVGGWGYYELQRRDTTMPADEWETVAEMGNPALVEVDDYEARVGVESSYRVRMVHASGVAGPWSATVTATINAPGVTGVPAGTPVLIFTSNEGPDGNLAYAPTWPGNPQEDFTFLEAGENELVTMHGRDYRVAFRPVERGGVEFVRTLLVNAAGVPAATMDKGFTGLRDLAWDDLPYVCVRDELANRWLSTLTVPGGSVRRVPDVGHLHLAQVIGTEITATPAPVEGGDPPCEGLTAGASEPYKVASTDMFAAAVGTLTVQDDFAPRTSAAGWGNAEPTGQPWTDTGGVAADYPVAAGVGQHSMTATGSPRTSTIGSLTNASEQITVTVPVVATGGPIHSAMLLRGADPAADHYRVQVNFLTDSTMTLTLIERAGGVDTTLDTGAVAGTYAPGTQVHIAGRVRAYRVQGKAWRSTDAEPEGWEVSADSTTHTGALPVGVRSMLDAANTNPLPVVLSYADFTAHRLMEDLDVRVELRPTGPGPYFWSADMIWGTVSGGGISVESSAQFGGSEGLIAGEVAESGFVEAWAVTEDFGVVTNRRRWVRWTYQSAAGGGNAQADLYSSDDGAAWTHVGTVTDTSEPLGGGGGLVDIYAYPQVTILQAEFRDGIGGTVIASPDFNAQPAGTTAFTDGQGNDWAVGGGICAA